MSTVFDADGLFPSDNAVRQAPGEEHPVGGAAPAAPAGDGVQAVRADPEAFDDFAGPEDEIEEELIIEDFTIDGICGVY
jgi:mycofactocin precursor